MMTQQNKVSLCKVGVSQEAAAALATQLTNALERGEKVLWLVSGGSSLPVAVAAMNALGDVDTSKLTVTLVDDVFNLPHGKLSNADQLTSLGFSGAAQFHPILQKSVTLEKTVSDFEDFLTEQLQQAGFTIGQFGLGAGLHTGGIQPGSPAAAEVKQLAVGYDDHGMRRITITPVLIQKLDVAFINSFGQDKRPLVKQFLTSTATIMQEPTQALKTARQCYLYSDVLPKT